MSSNQLQMAKNELRRCIMYTWPNYNGLGLNLKNSKIDGSLPHVIRDVDANSPAQFAGVLQDDLVLKVGNKVVEHEKFDSLLKIIKDHLKKEKKADLLLINAAYYDEFRRKFEKSKKIDFNDPAITSQIRIIEGPKNNPISADTSYGPSGLNTIGSASSISNLSNKLNPTNLSIASDLPPEPRLCHLLQWPNYDGYGFFVAYNSHGCFVKNVEPNSPAEAGGLLAFDRIVEVNGRPVDVKDKDFITKEISKQKRENSMKSRSATSLNRSRSSSASANSTYLNLLVVDPQTYKWLSEKKVDISTRNKSLKIRDVFTPVEQPVVNVYQQARDTVPTIAPTIKSNRSQSQPRPSDIAKLPENIIIKTCTVRRLNGRTDVPLGFEMTKRGTHAHFISRVEPNSAAELAGLKVNDYLIQLNSQNIDQDENSALREKMFSLLEPENGGEFRLLLIDRYSYDYCIQNNVPFIDFIHKYHNLMKYYETPKTGKQSPIQQTISNQNVVKTVINDTSGAAIAAAEQAAAAAAIAKGKAEKGTPLKMPPRVCVLHKTPDVQELGFSIARMKDLNEHIINDVVPGSLADRSGLIPEDRLLEVNGENVENRSHSDTVNKIISLGKLPSADISLMVAQPLSSKLGNVSHQPPAGATISSAVIAAATSYEIPSEMSGINTQSSGKAINKAISNIAINEMPSLNAYPEIKVCEFFGYPAGTQLGLVVTSDDYSHDVVKVGEGSPAAKACICQGDVIIAVNDYNVEGNASAIELLNEFNETKPLKVLLASRYAYEWSKLLRIKINEKDWPNIKRFSTKYTPGIKTNAYNNSIASQSSNAYRPIPINSSIYSQSNYAEPNSNNILMRNSSSYVANNISYSGPENGAVYKSTSSIIPITVPPLSASSNNFHVSRNPCPPTNYQNSQIYSEIPTYRSNVRVKSSASTVRSANTDQMSVLSLLSRSAVDITADGKVLRLCTLFLDPTSPNPTDAEFGFDLVTKLGGIKSVGDYFIDTIDENSPAAAAGLKSGDRLVEVDGIDVRSKSFEQVVQLINEAKLRCKLKLLVYPSVVINYGNPNISNNNEFNYQTQQYYEPPEQPVMSALSYQDSRSMPDLTIQHQQVVATNTTTVNPAAAAAAAGTVDTRNQNDFAKSLYKNRKANSKNVTSNTSEYGSIYTKKTSITINKSNPALNNIGPNLYGTTNANSSYALDTYQGNSSSDLLRPVPRLCTLFKNDQLHISSSQSSSNIGFGVQTKQTSALIPNYMRISIVNYKSPAYLAGLEAGDFIVEINGRNTLTMSHEEALHFIKSSYEISNYVKLLVVSEFCYNWLRENDLLGSINTDDNSIFSYADYLKNNHRYVPRLCKIRLFPFSKTFGFNLDTLVIRPSVGSNPMNKAAAYQSFAHIIIKVEKDSAAHAANLHKGDRIIECDGENVENENERQITDRIYKAFINAKQITLFVVDPDTDNFFKSKCIKLHSMLPIVQHVTNSTDI